MFWNTVEHDSLEIVTLTTGSIVSVASQGGKPLPDASRYPDDVFQLFDASLRTYLDRLIQVAITEAVEDTVDVILPGSGGCGLVRALFRRIPDGQEDDRIAWHLERLGHLDGLAYEPVRWLEFLAGVGGDLHQSLEVDTALQSIVSNAVPFISDWCTIDLVSSGDAYLRRVAVFHPDPKQARAVFAMRRKFPVVSPEDHPVVDVVRNGIASVIPHFSDERLTAMTRGAEHRSFIDSLGLRSSMIVPLAADGHVIGAITFSSTESGRTYQEADLARAEEYASSAALAIHNSQVHQQAIQLSRIREYYLSAASHEIRTPLAVISGFSALLARHLDSPQPDLKRVAVLLSELQQGVDRLEALTEDLLMGSSLHRSAELQDVEDVNLLELLNRVAQSIAVANPQSDGHITVEGDKSVTGRWNPVLLDRVFSNVIGNAVKYSPDSIDVRVSFGVENGEAARIDVSDSGIGISEDEQEALFLPFSRGGTARRMSEGTGLGLYITRQIVEQHKGSIEVRSTPGVGSTFTVRLPLCPKTLEAPSSPVV